MSRNTTSHPGLELRSRPATYLGRSTAAAPRGATGSPHLPMSGVFPIMRDRNVIRHAPHRLITSAGLIASRYIGDTSRTRLGIPAPRGMEAQPLGI